MFVPSSPSTYLALTVSLLILLLLIFRHLTVEHPGNRKHAGFSSSVPTVGVPSGGLMPWSRGLLRSVFKCADNASQGYYKFCKKNIPFALPVPGLGAVVAIPPSLLGVFNKSEDEVLSFMAQLEMIQPRWMIGGGSGIFERAHIQNDVVRKHFKNRVDLLAAPLSEELDAAFRESWGVDSEKWSTISTWDACSRVIVRAAARAFFGTPLSQNQALLDHSRLYANGVYMRSSFLNVLPAWMRPVLGPVLARSPKRHEIGCMEILTPFVDERLRAWGGGTNRDVPVGD